MAFSRVFGNPSISEDVGSGSGNLKVSDANRATDGRFQIETARESLAFHTKEIFGGENDLSGGVINAGDDGIGIEVP